ncbi:MAG: helix-hairpin-helix domain-containing protein [Candidatus Acidiferrum sp.]
MYLLWVAISSMMLRLASRMFLLLALLCVYVGCLHAKKKPPPAPININTANSEELQLVPGIGPATAEKILQMRKSYGPFKSVDDLRAIRGIGPKRLEKMRKYLTVGKAAGSSRPASARTPTASPAKPPSPRKPSTIPADPPCGSL